MKETENSELQRDSMTRDFDGNIETGFQIATLHGPLCAEPMEGMAFFVERVEMDRDGIRKENGRQKNLTTRSCRAITDVGYARAKQVVANYWITHFGHQRRV